MISEAFDAQGWKKPVELYEKYYEEQQQASRECVLAVFHGEFAGYVTVKWESGYQSFQKDGIPEISDLNVLLQYQRVGVGSALICNAERTIAQRSAVAGIGVGLLPDYGSAMKLYWRLGYKPDGLGITYRDQRCIYGARIPVDDDLILWMTKNVRGA